MPPVGLRLGYPVKTAEEDKMNKSEKWDKLEDYLTNKEQTILSRIKASALCETPNELRAAGAQLAVVQDILAHIDVLDKDQQLTQHGPPSHKY